MAGAKCLGGSHVQDDGAVLRRPFQLILRYFLEWRKSAEWFGSFEIQVDVVGEVGGPIRQIVDHLPNEVSTVLDLHRPVQVPLLTD